MKKNFKGMTAAALASVLTISSLGLFPSAAEGANSGSIVRDVNFRTAPSLSASTKGMLDRGDKITILSKPNKYWYKIKDDRGRVGYVSSLSKYVRTTSSSPARVSSASSSSSSSSRNAIVRTGKKYLGTPYQYGSNRATTTTFDCSDFVRHVYQKATGIKLPSNSRSQANYFKKNGKTTTNWRSLKPGDVIFFMGYKGTAKSNYTGINKSKQRISHNAIYLGNGKIMHTYSKNSGGVRIDTLAGKHWEYRMVFGGSIL
ncbi:C40 family peptidase [Marinicrinis sediminis]|uniref:C40 family peptidase n=1 Tax=Marinicrinis sediminis TaxID=1652465 RepID=A0ABW5RF30_9BACL